MGENVWGPPGQESWVTMDDGCDILLRKWAPEGRSVAVLHICHGLAEHSARYAGLAQRFVAEGFIVYASDNRAHGQTALRAEEKGVQGHRLGHVDVPNGKDVVQRIVEDHVFLCSRAAQEHGLPLVILGHSLGSVIATHLAANLKYAPAAVILSAAPARLPSLIHLAFGPLLQILSIVHGVGGVSQLISTLTFDKWNKEFAPNATDNDWLNRDAAEVQKYENDPLCGFKVSVGFWKSVSMAIKAAGSKETLTRLPKCPVLSIQGGQDPCTVNDLGTNSSQHLVSEFRAAGREIHKTISYSNGRHEILLETCREEVMQDLIEFLRRNALSPAMQSKL
ncbi:unnamed protein product [Symbiodinium natans]|uniref:Serine aminopeptidase S33 domain-containing protein n=1 Tax=Symbiodinium natans TaxID=878477 RepID=A0A812R0C4_9DINO|nr:unnamed protein product [Symbiodinium natans]